MSWKRAFDRSPCPVCGHLRHCTATDDGKLINCTRSPNDFPIRSTNTNEIVGYKWPAIAEWQPRIREAQTKRDAPKLPQVEIELKHRQFATSINPHRLRSHATALSVNIDALKQLEIGWDCQSQAWTFPMRDTAGRIVGLRYRRDNGAKWSLRGGREGLFSSPLTRDGPLIICEGPTSAAAWLTLGFDAIGRSNNTGGVECLKQLLPPLDRKVIIIADRDSRKTRPNGSHFWPGQDGARELYEQLRLSCRCRWGICPVSKDARDWIRAGATRATVVDWLRTNFSQKRDAQTNRDRPFADVKTKQSLSVGGGR